jgi:hypothetical protein
MSLLLALMLASSGDAWVVVHESSSSMSGSTRDLERARSFMQKEGAHFLWFRHAGREYIVRDGKALDAIKEAMRPQLELGEEQSRLGKKQSELGSGNGAISRGPRAKRPSGWSPRQWTKRSGTARPARLTDLRERGSLHRKACAHFFYPFAEVYR